MTRCFAYCTICETHQDSASDFLEDRLDDFCIDCGTELDTISEETYIQKVRESCDWPITFEVDVPAKMVGDYSHKIIEQVDGQILPFDLDEYYIDRRVGSVKATVKIDKEGKMEIST